MNHETRPPAGAMSKQELIESIWALRPQILGYIRSYPGRAEPVEDVFQQACAKFLASSATFTSLPPAKRYFFQTLRSVLIDGIRVRRKFHFVETPLEPSTESEEETWQRHLLAERVQEAIPRLSPRHQHILKVLLDPDLKRFKDRCQVLQLAGGTVRFHLKRIVWTLRRKLL